MHTFSARIAGLALFCCPACAQVLQNNMDFSFLGGAPAYSSSLAANPAVKVDEPWGRAMAMGWGFQVTRFSAARLWTDFGFLFVFRGKGTTSSVPGSVLNNFNASTLRARLMLPVHSRVSAYAALGGGVGSFYYASYRTPVDAGDSVRLHRNSTKHGVLDVAAGVDVWLSSMLSIRVETRDIVSGRGLSGAIGRNHVVALAGVALHY